MSTTSSEAELERLRALLAARDQELAARDQELAARDQELAARDQELVAERQAKAEQEREAARVQQALERSEAQVRAKEAEVEQLQEQLARLKRDLDQLAKQLFGKKSERVDRSQLQFGFADLDQAPAAAPPFLGEAPDDEQDEAGRGRRRRRRPHPGRLAISPDLPRERVEVPLGREACDCGGALKPLDEEITEELIRIPARFKVRQFVRTTCACARCERIYRPDPPPRPLDKCKAGASLLADVIVSKYADHLPLHRLAQIYARDGVTVPKQTLCDWIAGADRLLNPIVDAIWHDLLAQPLVQTDETGVLVLDRNAPGNRRKGRIWIFAGRPGELVYRHTPTKESRWITAMLKGYRGTLQADAYSGFDVLYHDGAVVEAGCNAHARRKFKQAYDLNPSAEAPQWALAAYQRLFAVEREAKERGLSPDERLQLRQEKSAPIVSVLYRWLESLVVHARPKSAIAKAARYALNHREALARFLHDGRVELDNNRAERALRAVALGRNNWLFAGSADGAHRAATLYSLVQSCKELGLDPATYLEWVLEHLAAGPPTREAAASLTPRVYAAKSQPRD